MVGVLCLLMPSVTTRQDINGRLQYSMCMRSRCLRVCLQTWAINHFHRHHCMGDAQYALGLRPSVTIAQGTPAVTDTGMQLSEVAQTEYISHDINVPHTVRDFRVVDTHTQRPMSVPGPSSRMPPATAHADDRPASTAAVAQAEPRRSVSHTGVIARPARPPPDHHRCRHLRLCRTLADYLSSDTPPPTEQPRVSPPARRHASRIHRVQLQRLPHLAVCRNSSSMRCSRWRASW